jgi:hypothetical protein
MFGTEYMVIPERLQTSTVRAPRLENRGLPSEWQMS